MKISSLSVGLLITLCLNWTKINKIVFSHNPFSMPQGEIKDLNFNKPLEMKAYQYDIVCNGVEFHRGQ